MNDKNNITEIRMKKTRELINKNKVVGFIPARGGSKNIPLKNIISIDGYPLIAHSILALKAAGIEKVWVSTDHKEIKATALKYGAKVIDRPAIISDDNSSSEQAITHFLKQVQCDTVVFVQATSPLLNSEHILKGIYKFFVFKYDSIFSAVKVNDMLIWQGGKYLKPINYNPKTRGTRQNRKNSTIIIETGGFFIFKAKEYMLEQCRMFGKIGFSEVPYWSSFQLDSKEDLKNITKLMEK